MERLTKFYERVNPENVVKIPSILEKYKNTLELLSRKLLKKYPKRWKHVIWHKPSVSIPMPPLSDDDD